VAKKDIGIARPILTRRCKRCGKFWAACHPKDDRELCERCRVDEIQVENTQVEEYAGDGDA